MAEETAIIVQPAEVEPESSEEFEVTKEWVEKLFSDQGAILAGLAESHRQMITILQSQGETLAAIQNRIPESLLQLMESDRQTVRELIAGQTATLQSLLTPPPPPPIVEPEPEPVAVVAPLGAATEPEKQPSRKRRVI